MTKDTQKEKMMANSIRVLAMDAVQKANSGHPGMPMGMADVATVLFNRFIKINPANPEWVDRDRFVLSAGHGSMLLYAIHYLLGYDDMDIEQIKNFRQLGSRTAGHPEYGHAKGIETTTGPLGQGISTSVGMAIAEKKMNAEFGNDLVDHYTYVIAGDGCLQEGISHEAIDLAGHLGLKKLIAFWDNNEISIDGSTSLSTSTNQLKRFKAAGWNTLDIDGHNYDEIANAIITAHNSKEDKPYLIACKTTIGFGSPNLAGSEKTHGSPLGEEEIAKTKENLGWSYDKFEIPLDVKDSWRTIANRGADSNKEWQVRFDNSPQKSEFSNRFSKTLSPSLFSSLKKFKQESIDHNAKVASRKASQMVLEVINSHIDITLGGSADLTHSNLTLTGQLQSINKDNFKGRYIHYGIREHGMAAAMNGIALHGGFIPYGGTFMVFSDYARGAMRLSALMGQQVIYVMTHDSIGLGEDGPTHQPIEHLAMLRATPNMVVMRPADIIETTECWEIALETKDKPSVLVLSRQNLPLLRKGAGENLSAKGGYIIAGNEDKRDLTIIATGSEVSLAFEAKEKLTGKNVTIISMPSWELFVAQPSDYQRTVLGNVPIIAIEAASSFGWERWLGDKGKFIGIDSFGASAPASQLYKHFNITADAICDAFEELSK